MAAFLKKTMRNFFLAVCFAMAPPCTSKVVEVFVDPLLGIDNEEPSAGSIKQPLRTVYAARDKVRSILQKEKKGDKTASWCEFLNNSIIYWQEVWWFGHKTDFDEVLVQLLPGTHHIGAQPLRLGPLDGGEHDTTVTWRSVLLDFCQTMTTRDAIHQIY